MRNLIVKIKKALAEIEAEKGAFLIKCLVARNPDDMQWDLILVADWFVADQIERFNYLSKKILNDFDIDCMSQFSGIVTIAPTSDLAKFLREIQNGYVSQHGRIYLNESVIINTDNKQAPMVVLLDNINTPAVDGLLGL
ncbi:MAG: hypothetical protein HQM12_23285 [SAR324 cluster bacterium]|nr:hypothetical protein [SAR324 cluster bacterium]